MKRLEEIVKSLEDGNFFFEEVIKFYEEGIRFIKVCNDIFCSVEKRVVLIEKLNGEYI